jgi:hypothetical protein
MSCVSAITTCQPPRKYAIITTNISKISIFKPIQGLISLTCFGSSQVSYGMIFIGRLWLVTASQSIHHERVRTVKLCSSPNGVLVSRCWCSGWRWWCLEGTGIEGIRMDPYSWVEFLFCRFSSWLVDAVAGVKISPTERPRNCTPEVSPFDLESRGTNNTWRCWVGLYLSGRYLIGTYARTDGYKEMFKQAKSVLKNMHIKSIFPSCRWKRHSWPKQTSGCT